MKAYFFINHTQQCFQKQGKIATSKTHGFMYYLACQFAKDFDASNNLFLVFILYLCISSSPLWIIKKQIVDSTQHETPTNARRSFRVFLCHPHILLFVFENSQSDQFMLHCWTLLQTSRQRMCGPKSISKSYSGYKSVALLLWPCLCQIRWLLSRLQTFLCWWVILVNWVAGWNIDDI